MLTSMNSSAAKVNYQIILKIPELLKLNKSCAVSSFTLMHHINIGFSHFKKFHLNAISLGNLFSKMM